jgi:UDP-N-acetylmuramoyl-tripeptide--D-alanyl-D-alanine ligase
MEISHLYAIFKQHPLISTDSRNCPKNSLFFALKGDKFDGNDYIEQVLNNGAAYAVGDRKDLPKNERIIQVDNVLQTLQNLANYHRKQMSATVVAITGSNGKTTTKELIGAVLSYKYKTLYTKGNLNNHIGVPLTLLQLTPEHEYAIIEMGANHIGEIRDLCCIADPDYGLITNIGKAHLEGFGSLEGVIQAKTELYDYLRQREKAIFANSDNPILKQFFAGLSVIDYGTSSDAFIQGHIIEATPTLALKWGKKNENEHHVIYTQLVGSYNFENVLAAICIGSYFLVEDEQINEAIKNYFPTNNRSQTIETAKNQLIIDAYNANPSSMRAALENFFTLPESPKMLILGEMRELGQYAKTEHQGIIDLLNQHFIEHVFLIGENFEHCSSLHPQWKIFSNTENLLDYLRTYPMHGFHVLIKGSRGNELEKTIEFL